MINLANYATDTATAGANLGIPLGEFDSLRFNLDFNNTKLRSSYKSSAEVLDFIQYYGGSTATKYTFNYLPWRWDGYMTL